MKELTANFTGMSHTAWRAISAYAICSIIMFLLIKAMVVGLAKPPVLAPLGLQQILILGWVYLPTVFRTSTGTTEASGVSGASGAAPASSVLPSGRLMRAAVPLAAMFLLNNALALAAAQQVSGPLFLAVRRTTVGFVLVLEMLASTKGSAARALSGRTWAAAAVLMVGTVLAGFDEVLHGASTGTGIAMLLASNATAALSLTWSRRVVETHHATSIQLLCAVAAWSAPLGLSAAALRGEWAVVHQQLSDGGLPYALTLFGYCVAGVLLSYTMLRCSVVTSPSVTSVTGVLKDIVTTALAWVLFTDFSGTARALLGLLLSFIGGIAFALSKTADVDAHKSHKLSKSVVLDSSLDSNVSPAVFTPHQTGAVHRAVPGSVQSGASAPFSPGDDLAMPAASQSPL